MGNLLDSAIKMQSSNGGANPTLVINFNDYSGGGGSCDVYKNGAFFDSAISGTPLNVLIVAGNTFYLQISAPFTGFINAQYNINNVYQTNFNTTSTLNTTTITASGTNAYSYDVVADFF